MKIQELGSPLLKIVGTPTLGRGVTTPSDSQSINTPQDPAEDAPKKWNYQKANGIFL